MVVLAAFCYMVPALGACIYGAIAIAWAIITLIKCIDGE